MFVIPEEKVTELDDMILSLIAMRLVAGGPTEMQKFLGRLDQEVLLIDKQKEATVSATEAVKVGGRTTNGFVCEDCGLEENYCECNRPLSELEGMQVYGDPNDIVGQCPGCASENWVPVDDNKVSCSDCGQVRIVKV